MTGRRFMRCGGFTLVELIITMIVIGILAVVAMPRFANQLTFETRGFVDQTVATLQYARKVAVASGRNVCVSASSGGNTLTQTMATARGWQSGSCVGGTAITNPAATWRKDAAVTYGSALSTTFGGDGSATPVPGFTVTGDNTTYTIVVESTGYVHCSPVTACE